MKTEKRKVPELRFKEFTEEWKEKKLGKIAILERGRFSPRPRNNPIYYNGNVPFVQTSDVVNSKGYIKTHTQTLNERGLSVSKLFNKGDILITIAANIGYAGVLQYDMACPDSLIGIICNNTTNNLFLCLLLNNEQQKMDYLAVAAAQKNINLDFLKPYKLFIPSLPEQQKIASFLSKVDEKIEKTEKKKELFEQYKKGMMQKIFSQQIRFKDNNGNDYPDWEEKKLREISQRITRKNIEYNTNVLTISAQQGLVNQKEFFNKSVAGKNLDSYYLLFKDDFAYNKSYSKGYPLGAIKRLKNYQKGIVSTLYICFEIKDGSVEFFEQFFESGILNKEISKIAQEGARNHGLLNISVIDFFEQITIKVPSLPEQQKIASFLSSIDQKIETIDKELQNLKQFKKGLLQKMFV